MANFTIALVAVFLGIAVFARLRRDDSIAMPNGARGLAESQSLEELVLAGRKIDAIKQLRRESGLGLREAKDEIDKLSETLRIG